MNSTITRCFKRRCKGEVVPGETVCREHYQDDRPKEFRLYKTNYKCLKCGQRQLWIMDVAACHIRCTACGLDEINEAWVKKTSYWRGYDALHADDARQEEISHQYQEAERRRTERRKVTPEKFHQLVPVRSRAWSEAHRCECCSIDDDRRVVTFNRKSVTLAWRLPKTGRIEIHRTRDWFYHYEPCHNRPDHPDFQCSIGFHQSVEPGDYPKFT
jgi:hypothetical protein